MWMVGQNMTNSKIIIQNYDDVILNYNKFKTLIGHEIKITYSNYESLEGIFIGFNFVGFDLLQKDGIVHKCIKFYNNHQSHYSHMKFEYEL